MEVTVTGPVDEPGALALGVTLDGLEAGRFVLVTPDSRLELVGDGVGALLGAPAPEPGADAATVLGDVGRPLPAGVARCVPPDAGWSLEATFAPVDEAVAGVVREELRHLAATLGAPAERPALRALLAGVAGRAARTGPGGDQTTLVLLRRLDEAPPAPSRSAPPVVAAAAPPPPPEAYALAPVLDELSALRAEVEVLRSRDPGVPSYEHSALEAELRIARTDAELARREVGTLRDELVEVREELQRTADELGEAVRAAVLVSEDARRDARAARADAETARAEVARDRDAIEPSATVRPERVVEIWRQMLAGTADAPPPAPAPAPGPARTVHDMAARSRVLDAHDRPSIPGFDDVPVPLAQVALDGRFRRLNPAFAHLVGYPEPEFLKATWPSLLDREVHDTQCEHRRQLIEGVVDHVPLDASYLGGQGLLVTVRGHVELARDPSGEPSHLLLVGEDRHTL